MIELAAKSDAPQFAPRDIRSGVWRRMLFVTMLTIAVVHQDFAVSVSAGARSTGVPQFDEAVAAGVKFLKASAGRAEPSRKALAAYALFKAGEPLSSPIVAEGIEIAASSVSSGGFRPRVEYDHIYESGLFAMFLADVDPVRYQPVLQKIAEYVESAQRDDGSWSVGLQRDWDISMCQYALLALWAAQRAGCEVSPETLDRSAAMHRAYQQGDGGWTYNPAVRGPSGKAESTRNMTLAAVSSLGIAETLFYGPPKPKKEKPVKKFGVLEEDTSLVVATEEKPAAFPTFKPTMSRGDLRKLILAGITYEQKNYNAVNRHDKFPLYFYYTAERALSIAGIREISGNDWYQAYGEGLLVLQGESGSWKETWLDDQISGTSFAILFFMRSTQQILDKLYGPALQRGNRGNPFGDKPVAAETKSLDMLLSAIDNVDLNNSELNEAPDLADDIVRSVTSIRDPKELIGQKERLKALVNHPEPDVRRPVYWALGKTGELSLVPTILKGLRDSSVDVNVEAEQALRFIARRPAGFGYPVNPLDGAETADERTKTQKVRAWRDKAVKSWLDWYLSVQSFEDQQTVNQVELFRLKNPDAVQ
ncbi:MAG: hypothetical protein ACK50J_09120 [Planctomyces sp.]